MKKIRRRLGRQRSDVGRNVGLVQPTTIPDRKPGFYNREEKFRHWSCNEDALKILGTSLDLIDLYQAMQVL